MSDASNNNEVSYLNADAVIDRFGGIRPMAAKIGVAVTTVQGWKKRNSIPANRQDMIEQAARLHNIDLSNLPAIGGQSLPSEERGVEPLVNDQQTESEIPLKLTSDESDPLPPSPVSRPEPVHVAPQGVQKSGRVAQTSWVALMILAVAIVIGLLAMAPGVNRLVIQEQRLASLERELQQMGDHVRSVESRNALLAGLVPDDLKKQIELLAERARLIEAGLGNLDTQTRALTAGVMGAGDGTIEQRLSTIEEEMKQFSTVDQAEQMSVFMTRVQQWQSSADGRRILEAATAQMIAAIGTVQDPVLMISQIKESFKTSPELKQTFDDLGDAEIRAGMLLLTVTHLRQSLMKGNVPFDRDLTMLRDALPIRDDDLTQVVTNLLPQAKTGITPVVQLADGLKELVPQLVAASLEGQSWTEKMQARLHDVLKIERAGQSLTGTATQQALDTAIRQLEAGDPGAALTTLQILNGQAAVIAAPWVKRAEMTVLALQLQDQLTKMVSVEISVQPFMQQLKNLQSGAVDPQNIIRGVIQSLSSSSSGITSGAGMK